MPRRSLAVVTHTSRALAPLGVGGPGKGEEGTGKGKGTRLAAVWAIVQAYAIVALVCTVYSFMFGGAVQTVVLDEAQVRVVLFTRDPARRKVAVPPV